MNGTPSWVLVVDDDHALIALLTACLEDAGFEVASAYDGREALARLTEHTFCAIVLDLQMPVMDGPAFWHEARSRGHAIPTLLLSATHGVHKSARELGIEASMAKPFDPDKLCATVGRLCTSAPARPPGPLGVATAGP